MRYNRVRYMESDIIDTLWFYDSKRNIDSLQGILTEVS